MTGKEMIDALNNCNDDCKNCVASTKGKSCKDMEKAWKKWAKKQSEKFGETLHNENQI